MADSLQVHLDDATGAVATFGPVIYVVWRAHDSSNNIVVADKAVKQLVAQYGPGRKLFYVQRAPADGSVVKTKPEVRDAAMNHFEETDEHFWGTAVAIEVEGFAGSIIRSVTAGVMLVRRTTIKTETFKDARQGVRWLALAAKDVNPFDGDAMVRALEEKGLALRT